MRIENEHLKDKIGELERWLVMLLNNFYEGNPASLRNIEDVRIHNSKSIGSKKNRRAAT